MCVYIRTAGAVWWDGGRGSIGAMRGGSNPGHVRNGLLLDGYSRRYSMVVPLTLCRMFQNFQCLYSVKQENWPHELHTCSALQTSTQLTLPISRLPSNRGGSRCISVLALSLRGETCTVSYILSCMEGGRVVVV